MGFLAGKRLLVTGVLSNRSIAYGIARACRREGAELAFSYQGERFKERVAEFAAEFGSTLVFDCDVADDAQIERHVRRPRRQPGRPSTASSTRSASRRKEAIAGDFLEGLSREAFRIAHDISSYSFPALAKAAAPRLEPERRAAHPDLSGGDAQRSQLQHDGPGQGLARGLGALPGGEPRPEGRARQRHLGRADQDAGGLGHQGLRQDPRRRRSRTRRCAATSRSTTSATPPRSCSPTWPRA